MVYGRGDGTQERKPAGVIGGFSAHEGAQGGSAGHLLLHCTADVDDVVGNDAEAYPSAHSDETPVATTGEAVSPLDDADAPFRSSAPFLTVAEPALSLFALAFRAFGRAIGNANAFDAFRFRSSLVLGGVECGIRRHQVRRASQPCLMHLDGGHQQV